MPIKWKICDGCGRKYNEIVEVCPHCHSKSFTDYEKSKKEGTAQNVNSESKKQEDTTQNAESGSKKEDTAQNVNSESKKQEDTTQNAESGSKKQEDDVSDNSKNKFKEDLDKFSNNVKKAGNDFLYKNLPEEYADKLKNDFNNFSQYAGEVATNISDSTFKIGEGLVNDNISKESQEKIKLHGGNISNSTKKFIEDTSTTISNIHQHRQKIRNEKKEQKRKEKEEKKRKKEEERRERERRREEERRRREEERRRREEKINQDHERGVAHFKKGVEYYNDADIEKCHQELEASFDLLKQTSSYYSAAKLYYVATFLGMTNVCLANDPTYVFSILDVAVKETPNAVDSFNKNDSYCRNALNELKNHLFLPMDVNYFNLDFSTEFGRTVAAGWLLVVLECKKIDLDYRYEKFDRDLSLRAGLY